MKKIIALVSLLLPTTYLLTVENVLFSLDVACKDYYTTELKSDQFELEKLVILFTGYSKFSDQGEINEIKLPEKLEYITKTNGQWYFVKQIKKETEAISILRKNEKTTIQDLQIKYFDNVTNQSQFFLDYYKQCMLEIANAFKKYLA